MWRSDRPLILGHRGASASAPENTWESFQLAIQQGADGIELDVRRTADGVDIIHHDAATPGGRSIVLTTFDDLRAAEPQIPTLAEVLDLQPGIVNIEIKNSPVDPDFDPDNRIAARVLAAVMSRSLADRVIVSSFNPTTLAVLEDSGLELGLLLPPGTDVGDLLSTATGLSHLSAIHPFDSDVDDVEGLKSAANHAEVRVVVWTVDAPERIRELGAFGVDAIITNDPAAARQALTGAG